MEKTKWAFWPTQYFRWLRWRQNSRRLLTKSLFCIWVLKNSMWFTGCGPSGALDSPEKVSTLCIHSPSPNQNKQSFHSARGLSTTLSISYKLLLASSPRWASCQQHSGSFITQMQTLTADEWKWPCPQCLLGPLSKVMLGTMGFSGEWVCVPVTKPNVCQDSPAVGVPEVAYFSSVYTSSVTLSLVNMEKVQSKNKPTENNSCLWLMAWCSEWSPWTSNISIPWLLVRNSDFQAPPRTYRVRCTGVQANNLCFSKPSRWFWCSVKFESIWCVAWTVSQIRWQGRTV